MQIFLCRMVSAPITGLEAYAASLGQLNRIDKKVCKVFARTFQLQGI